MEQQQFSEGLREKLLKMSTGLSSSPVGQSFVLRPVINIVVDKIPASGTTSNNQDVGSTGNPQQNKNPFFSKIPSGSIRPLRNKDSVADVLAKIYNFMRKDYDQTMKNAVDDDKFRKKHEREKERRNEELLKIFGEKDGGKYHSVDDGISKAITCFTLQPGDGLVAVIVRRGLI